MSENEPTWTLLYLFIEPICIIAAWMTNLWWPQRIQTYKIHLLYKIHKHKIQLAVGEPFQKHLINWFLKTQLSHWQPPAVSSLTVACGMVFALNVRNLRGIGSKCFKNVQASLKEATKKKCQKNFIHCVSYRKPRPPPP